MNKIIMIQNNHLSEYINSLENFMLKITWWYDGPLKSEHEGMMDLHIEGTRM